MQATIRSFLMDDLKITPQARLCKKCTSNDLNSWDANTQIKSSYLSCQCDTYCSTQFLLCLEYHPECKFHYPMCYDSLGHLLKDEWQILQNRQQWGATIQYTKKHLSNHIYIAWKSLLCFWTLLSKVCGDIAYYVGEGMLHIVKEAGGIIGMSRQDWICVYWSVD